jgi:uncharacterized membrane protein
MTWTSGYPAAYCLGTTIVSSLMLTIVMTPSTWLGVLGTPSETHTAPCPFSKESNMNAHASDEGRVPDMSRRGVAGKRPSQNTRATKKGGSAPWLVPVLLVLSIVPLAAGAVRLTELAGGVEITAANARFFASPLPVVLHIVSAAVYALLGSFQFAPGFRKRRPGWHRAAGRLLVGCGLLVGLSGLWMTLFYPEANDASSLLYALRLLFGLTMVVSVVLGLVTIRCGEIQRHRAWMARGYAIGLGAGTQVLTLGLGEAVAGPPTERSRALLMGAAWAINLFVAECAIQARATRASSVRARTASAPSSHVR